MSYTPPWPDELRTGPFTVSEAARHGVGRRRANAASVHRPHPLLRAIEPVTSAVDLCQALARTLPPEAAFSHLTAARLWGLPWSSEWSLEEPVHVMLPEGAGRVRRRGIRAHVGLEHRTVTTVKGLRVTSIEDTWGDLTSVDGVTVEDLVVAADAIVCWKTCRDPDLLSRLADRRDGYPGVVLLREALPLVRTRSASPMESRTRLRFRDDGIPEPKLNAPVRDRHGQWLAEGDFVWEAEGVVADYDGAVHANPQLMRRDAARRSLITHADWTYEQITADTYYKPAAWAALIDRLRAKLT